MSAPDTCFLQRSDVYYVGQMGFNLTAGVLYCRGSPQEQQTTPVYVAMNPCVLSLPTWQTMWQTSQLATPCNTMHKHGDNTSVHQTNV